MPKAAGLGKIFRNQRPSLDYIRPSSPFRAGPPGTGVQSVVDAMMSRWTMKTMKPAMQGSLLQRFRMAVVLCGGCAAFLLLHKAFGGIQTYSPELAETFPRKIWQSWKVDPLRFEERDTYRAMSWTTKNPSYRYEVLTDDNAVTYVEQHFGRDGFNRPDVVAIYKALSARIIQADLLRYLIMYVEGGVWADIDVEAIRPIRHFIPQRHSEQDVKMVVGVETDEPSLKDHPVLGSKAMSFVQWTFMCKPRLPVMMRLIDNILIWLSDLSIQQGKPISELDLNFDEVLSGTGPSAFTTAILAEMSATTGRKVTWADFHDLEESKIVGGVLVLTSEAFAAGTGHSRSGNHNGKGALIKHHFHASTWTQSHPRFKHPIYGEVERCNWDIECVKLWDANTAFFASLPKEDQMRMISLKARGDAGIFDDGVISDVMAPLVEDGKDPQLGFPEDSFADDLSLLLPPDGAQLSDLILGTDTTPEALAFGAVEYDGALEAQSDPNQAPLDLPESLPNAPDFALG